MYIVSGVLAFLMLSTGENIPEGYRLATVKDVTQFQTEARDAITEEWGILTLEDGEIRGSGYGYEVKSGSFGPWGHKLVVTASGSSAHGSPKEVLHNM